MAVYSLGGISPDLPREYWIAPDATVIGDVKLLELASIWFQAVIRGDREPIIVGAGSNVQDGCVLHTDPGCPLTVGNGCTIGHRAILHGCTVGDNTLIGMGATVLNRAVIGRNCLIGANALIPEGKVIPDGSLVIGAPGKVVRQLDEAAIASIAKSAETYVANWRRYAADFGSIKT